MKYKIYKNKFLLSTVAVIVIFCHASCKKFIEVPSPINQLTTDKVFSDSTTAVATVYGLYSSLCNSTSLQPVNGGITILPGLSADELYRTTALDTYSVFSSNAIPVSSEFNANSWSNFYLAIYQANTIIENVKKASALSSSLSRQLEGEVKVLRAMLYFYLVNYYGSVPLANTSDYRTNAVLARSEPDKIYTQIVADLTDAQNLLSNTYTVDGKLRANKQAAIALLARVYLYQKEWAKADATSSLIISSGSFQLGTLSNAFLATSPEAIFQFTQPLNSGINTADGFFFVPSTGATAKPAYALTDTLYRSFEKNDLRKTNWVGTKTISGVAYNYPLKYKVRSATAGAAKTEHSIVLRLSEQYLIRAEARAWLGNLNGAIADVDLIRKRAGLPLIGLTNPSISKEDLLNVINHENKMEFFAEWGHRWFDLKRNGSINSVLGGIKAGWKPTAALYPVPSHEILIDKNLTQNPGY